MKRALQWDSTDDKPSRDSGESSLRNRLSLPAGSPLTPTAASNSRPTLISPRSEIPRRRRRIVSPKLSRKSTGGAMMKLEAGASPRKLASPKLSRKSTGVLNLDTGMSPRKLDSPKSLRKSKDVMKVDTVMSPRRLESPNSSRKSTGGIMKLETGTNERKFDSSKSKTAIRTTQSKATCKTGEPHSTLESSFSEISVTESKKEASSTSVSRIAVRGGSRLKSPMIRKSGTLSTTQGTAIMTGLATRSEIKKFDDRNSDAIVKESGDDVGTGKETVEPGSERKIRMSSLRSLPGRQKLKFSATEIVIDDSEPQKVAVAKSSKTTIRGTDTPKSRMMVKERATENQKFFGTDESQSLKATHSGMFKSPKVPSKQSAVVTPKVKIGQTRVGTPRPKITKKISGLETPVSRIAVRQTTPRIFTPKNTSTEPSVANPQANDVKVTELAVQSPELKAEESPKPKTSLMRFVTPKLTARMSCPSDLIRSPPKSCPNVRRASYLSTKVKRKSPKSELFFGKKEKSPRKDQELRLKPEEERPASSEDRLNLNNNSNKTPVTSGRISRIMRNVDKSLGKTHTGIPQRMESSSPFVHSNSSRMKSWFQPKKILGGNKAVTESNSTLTDNYETQDGNSQKEVKFQALKRNTFATAGISENRETGECSNGSKEVSKNNSNDFKDEEFSDNAQCSGSLLMHKSTERIAIPDHSLKIQENVAVKSLAESFEVRGRLKSLSDVSEEVNLNIVGNEKQHFVKQRSKSCVFASKEFEQGAEDTDQLDYFEDHTSAQNYPIGNVISNESGVMRKGTEFSQTTTTGQVNVDIKSLSQIFDVKATSKGRKVSRTPSRKSSFRKKGVIFKQGENKFKQSGGICGRSKCVRQNSTVRRAARLFSEASGTLSLGEPEIKKSRYETHSVSSLDSLSQASSSINIKNLRSIFERGHSAGKSGMEENTEITKNYKPFRSASIPASVVSLSTVTTSSVNDVKNADYEGQESRTFLGHTNKDGNYCEHETGLGNTHSQQHNATEDKIETKACSSDDTAVEGEGNAAGLDYSPVSMSDNDIRKIKARESLYDIIAYCDTSVASDSLNEGECTKTPTLEVVPPNSNSDDHVKKLSDDTTLNKCAYDTFVMERNQEKPAQSKTSVINNDTFTVEQGDLNKRNEIVTSDNEDDFTVAESPRKTNRIDNDIPRDCTKNISVVDTSASEECIIRPTIQTAGCDDNSLYTMDNQTETAEGTKSHVATQVGKKLFEESSITGDRTYSAFLIAGGNTDQQLTVDCDTGETCSFEESSDSSAAEKYNDNLLITKEDIDTGINNNENFSNCDVKAVVSDTSKKPRRGILRSGTFTVKRNASERVENTGDCQPECNNDIDDSVFLTPVAGNRTLRESYKYSDATLAVNKTSYVESSDENKSQQIKNQHITYESTPISRRKEARFSVATPSKVKDDCKSGWSRIVVNIQSSNEGTGRGTVMTSCGSRASESSTVTSDAVASSTVTTSMMELEGNVCMLELDTEVAVVEEALSSDNQSNSFHLEEERKITSIVQLDRDLLAGNQPLERRNESDQEKEQQCTNADLLNENRRTNSSRNEAVLVAKLNRVENTASYSSDEKEEPLNEVSDNEEEPVNQAASNKEQPINEVSTKKEGPLNEMSDNKEEPPIKGVSYNKEELTNKVPENTVDPTQDVLDKKEHRLNKLMKNKDNPLNKVSQNKMDSEPENEVDVEFETVYQDNLKIVVINHQPGDMDCVNIDDIYEEALEFLSVDFDKETDANGNDSGISSHDDPSFDEMVAYNLGVLNR